MKSHVSFSLLKGDYSFRALFFIIFFVQVLVSSVLTVEFYLIQHNESSNEFAVTKSFSVATITSCVLKCSASSNICDKTEIKIKENDQKLCHLLKKKQPKEPEKLSKRNSSETGVKKIGNEKSFMCSPNSSVRPLNKDCKFKKEEAVYVREWVLQKRNLCYDATKHSSKTGLFKATQLGNVTQVKLVHVKGFVQNYPNSIKVYWGNVIPTDDCAIDYCFGTLIVNANREIVFPHNTKMNSRYSFNLEGFTDPKSTYITMSRESNPYIVGKDEEFQIIIGRQLKHGEDYHAGTHCVDVYFYYE